VNKVGIVVFPGSNCERDCEDAVIEVMGAKPVFLWHREADLQGVDMVILPGGFSYGDYLRCGAIARFSPIMQSVVDFAAQGRPVLGICNGFQILTEAGLLPGSLVKNRSLRFLCEHVTMTVETTDTPYTQGYERGQEITLPVAHAEGNFVADADTLAALEDGGQIVFRYTQDINGACQQIAGIVNASKNVLGMMPHPERQLVGDGRTLFQSLIAAAV
jgi:phosphoribosylformylglycinamidine synthase I